MRRDDRVHLAQHEAVRLQGLQHGALMGAAKEGRIAAAARADYAAAAVAVLTTPGHEGQVYELAGDQPFTMRELAAEVSRQAGKPVAYDDMPAEQYVGALQGVGLPAPVAQMLASADLGISRGELDERSGMLRRLIGRPTTPLARAVAAALPSAWPSARGRLARQREAADEEPEADRCDHPEPAPDTGSGPKERVLAAAFIGSFRSAPARRAPGGGSAG